MINLIKKIFRQKKNSVVAPLDLIPLKKTAVNTRTPDNYDELMRVYELGNWRWYSGDLPTESYSYWRYKEQTGILAQNEFVFNSRNFLLMARHKVISLPEFYEIQKITPSMLKEINEYFENKAKDI